MRNSKNSLYYLYKSSDYQIVIHFGLFMDVFFFLNLHKLGSSVCFHVLSILKVIADTCFFPLELFLQND